jgi:hypothetical protein
VGTKYTLARYSSPGRLAWKTLPLNGKIMYLHTQRKKTPCHRRKILRKCTFFEEKKPNKLLKYVLS